jgi:hypothetical protein
MERYKEGFYAFSKAKKVYQIDTTLGKANKAYLQTKLAWFEK